MINTEQQVTSNITPQNEDLKFLKSKFPNCFDKSGNFDFDKFRGILTNADVNFTNENYSLDWLGKSYARIIATDPATTLIKEDREWNLNDENKHSHNLLIKGDNLEILKHLSNAYFQKIKMIYIDPPYNTGSDGFVYQDDRKFSVNELKEMAGIDEEKANKILKFLNSKSNSHSAWLTFMYPRLYIARQLLKEDGVIFVSIDDNEVSQLRILMDEIYGEENLISVLKIQVRYESKSLNEKKDFQELQEYVLIYAKNSNLCKFNKPTEEYSLNKFDLDITHSENPTKSVIVNGRKMDIWTKGNFSITKVDNPSENYFKETWLSGSIYSNTGHGTMYKKMIENRISEDGNEALYRIHGIGEDGLGYRYYTNPKDKKYNKGKMYTKIPLDKLENIKNGEIVQKENPIISYYDFSADFGNIGQEGGVSFNSGKKPVKMLKQFINYLQRNSEDDIILDFFAGSGSTADAVMQLNAEDTINGEHGNRKFILVQIPEKIDEKKNKTAFDFVKNELKADPTIFEITKERIIRARKKILSENNINLLNQNNIDLGFKIFETINIWEDYVLQAKEFNSQIKLFNESKLSEEDIKSLLVTWKTYDNVALTDEFVNINLDGYFGYYAKNKLYLMDKGFETKHLKALINKLDDDHSFNPNTIIVFGYNFASINLREISENISSYSNKKNLEIDFIIRY